MANREAASTTDGIVMTSPYSHVRIARPTSRLDAVVSFYTEGVGLPLLGRFADHAGYSGAFIGLPGAGHHLEFTSHINGSPCPAPTRDNLLVLYLRDRLAAAEVVGRLAGSGHPAVEPENPYWNTVAAITVEDPDGWRVVLVPSAWPGA